MKIFYWSPYLSNVATISNVINSAYSLKKYQNNNYTVKIIDAAGEWKKEEERIEEKKIEYEKINSFDLSSKFPISGFIKSRFFSSIIFIRSFFPLLNLLKKQKPEYLIIHLLTSLPLILLLFFNFKTKFILRISGLPKLNIFRKFLWQLTNKKICSVTCPTNETKDHIIKLNIFSADKVVLLNDPIINVSEIKNKKKKKNNETILEKEYFLNIGRLTEQKNHILLIKLFFNLKKNTNINLYILGDGEEKDNILREIKKYSLQERVFLLGYKKNIYPYILSAKAIISTSLWEDPGAVMIESAFCNKIVISSDCVSGPKEFLMNNDAGYLFKNNNLESLQEACQKFLHDSEQTINAKKILAKKNSKNYTIYKHYRELKKILI